MRIFLFFSGVIILGCGFLFLASREGLEALCRLLERPIARLVFDRRQDGLNRRIEVDAFFIRHRRIIAAVIFLTAILIIGVSLYQM
ncbi:MAG: hypothetical protein JW844_00185 [Candidatus Omnitrophica bacterium]|nr:hypothetical protein [Candidatus Omnitrophota bacterium]